MSSVAGIAAALADAKRVEKARRTKVSFMLLDAGCDSTKQPAIYWPLYTVDSTSNEKGRQETRMGDFRFARKKGAGAGAEALLDTFVYPRSMVKPVIHEALLH